LTKWRNIWPFLGAAVLYTAGNPDYVIIPFVLEPLGLSFWTMFWVVAFIANLEIIGGYFFWRWFVWTWLPKTKPIKETIKMTKSIIDLLIEYGLLGTIEYKIRETFEWATNPNRNFVQFIKRWGHVGMFCLGAESFVSGGRSIGTIACASTKWPRGLYALIIGNFIHIATTIWTWKLFFYLWDKYKLPVIVVGVVFAILIGMNFIRKKLNPPT